MEKKYAKIRSALKNASFKPLEFSDEMKSKVQQQIMLEEQRDELYLTILQLLVKEKTGFELNQLLMARSTTVLNGNEGMLYTSLHRLERERLLDSNWDEEGAKYYRLTNKGRKVLDALEKGQREKNVTLRKLVEG